MSLLDAHELAESVHVKIAGAFPGADIIIHQDPHTDAAGFAH